MKIFVLYDNVKHDFSSLRSLGGEVKFIFSKHSIENLTLDQCRKVLENVLDQADVNTDLIVMNGPSYMTAIAGYVWLSREERTKYNMVAWNLQTRKFEIKSNMELINELQ